MCGTHQVLALVALYVKLVHSWDIAVSVGDRIEFYTNGTKTDTLNLTSHNPSAIAYDEVHHMMLFVDKQSDSDAICGYNLISTDIRCFIKRYGSNIQDLAFDPVTDLLFFTDTKKGSINWFSLNDQESANNVYGNVLIELDDRIPSDIAVDSCRGFIYWSHKSENYFSKYMERARFNGSERKVIYDWLPVYSFVFDPQTHTNYYIDGLESAHSAHYSKVDLREEYLNREKADFVYGGGSYSASAPKELTVTNYYLYWMNNSASHTTIWHGPKLARNNEYVEFKEFCKFFSERPLGITANYKIREQVQGVQDCEALSNLIPTITVTNNARNTEERKEETEPTTETDQTTESREVHACHGYCLNNGTCSLNEKNEPVCQCEGEYVGDRCEVSSCLNYCFQGSCSFNYEGYPECRCNAGFSGERCEVAACHGYCLNNGECTLNEEDEPACQCVGDYEGSRCEATKGDIVTSQCYSAKRNLTLADLLSKIIIIDV